MTIRPSIGKFDLTMIVVSLVIGIGIFRTPAMVAQKSNSEFIFYASWIIGGVISICGALTFAEIGSRYPVAGGFYKVFSHCYHPAFAFMLNWSLVITNSFSAVGVGIVGAEYIAPVVLPTAWQTPEAVRVLALCMVLILFGLNYAGIKTGARAQNILSGIKIVMILLFCSALFLPHVAASQVSSPVPSNWFTVLGISLISVFFTYGGYQSTINFGADVSDPRRNIPASIFAGMGIVIFLYLFINVAYVSVLGFDKVQHSPLLASELSNALFGEKGYAITSIAIFISVMGFINTGLINNPRVYYAMADDGILPSLFKKLNSKTQVQEFALSFYTALMLIGLLWLGTFEKIVNYVMLIDSLSLVTAAFTIFILRKQMKSSDYAGFKVRLYPWIPLLFILMLAVVMYSVYLSDRQAAISGVCIFAGGFPLYHLLRYFSRTTSKEI